MNDSLSLLWPEGKKNCYTELPEDTLKDLDVAYLVGCIAKTDPEKESIFKILSQMPVDQSVVEYRSSIYADIMEHADFRAALSDLTKEIQLLGEFSEAKVRTTDYSSVWDLINRLKELYSYITCVEKFDAAMREETFESKGLNELKTELRALYEQSGFQYLKQDIERLTEDIGRVKSLTLGVNLDQDLNPCEVQLVSMNTTTYTGKDNGILRAFVTCFAGSMSNSLLKNHNGVDPLMKALTGRVEEMLSTVARDMRQTLVQYVDINGCAITRFLPELLFYIRFADEMSILKEAGLPVSRAKCVSREGSVLAGEIASDGDIVSGEDITSDGDTASGGDMKVTGFYNLKLALFLQRDREQRDEIVTNDLIFDASHRQYILTGPNRGGKTIFTQATGILYLLAQAGIYVPAQQMTFVPVDHIYTHFPADENQTVALGRLGEEAKRIHAIMEHATGNSLILLNESLSTTSFSEGLYLARDVVRALNYMGAKVIFNTHMHELATDLEKLSTGTDNSIVSLVMKIEGQKRSYRAVIAPPTGSSYARDIAQKYGILFDHMKQVIDQNQQGMQ